MESTDHDIFRQGYHGMVSILALADSMKESYDPHF